MLVVWAVSAAVLVLQLLPDTPRTPRGWVLLLVIGPPAYIVLELASSRLFSDKAGARISTARFSVTRIAVALLVALVVLAPFAWFAWWVLHAR